MITPNNVDEAVEALKEELTPQEQMSLVRMTESELIRCHHGLGQWIRNNWGLWAGGNLKTSMQAMGFYHPDDMSQAIIREYWHRMNNLPSTLEADAQHSTEWFLKQGKQ